MAEATLHSLLLSREPRAIPADAAAALAALYAKALFELLRQLQIYISCCFSILLWDYFITVRDEVNYVWLAKLTPVKVCFYINRYLTLAHLTFVMVCAFSKPLMAHCSKIYRLQDYVPIVIYICCNFKLAQRCCALFPNPRPVFWGLMLLITTQAVVQAVISASNTVLPIPPGAVGCYTSPAADNLHYAFVYWVMPLITNTVILVLSTAKILQYWADSGKTHLLELLLKDGVQYYAVVCSVNIVNVVYMKSQVSFAGVKLTGGPFNAPLAVVITSIMVSRLGISMRKTLSEDHEPQFTTGRRGADNTASRPRNSMKPNSAWTGEETTLPSHGLSSSHIEAGRPDESKQETPTASFVSKLLGFPACLRRMVLKVKDRGAQGRRGSGAGVLQFTSVGLPALKDISDLSLGPARDGEKEIELHARHLGPLASGYHVSFPAHKQDDEISTVPDATNARERERSTSINRLEEGTAAANHSVNDTSHMRHSRESSGLSVQHGRVNNNFFRNTSHKSASQPSPASGPSPSRTLSNGSSSSSSKDSCMHMRCDSRPFAASRIDGGAANASNAGPAPPTTSPALSGGPFRLANSTATIPSINVANQIFVTTEQVVRSEGREGM